MTDRPARPLARMSTRSPLGLAMPCLAAGLIAVAAVALGCGSGPSSSGDAPAGAPIALAEPVAIGSHRHGSDATLTLAPGVYLIDSAMQAHGIGSGALTDAVQNVDWATQQVLVATLGEQPTGGYWTRIHSAQREGSTLYVQYTANQPAGPASTVITRPYCIAVIERQPGVTRVVGESRSVRGEQPPA
ncbi:MAG: protease complex subunit PrcB family protein [Planctomycetota bacterium]